MKRAVKLLVRGQVTVRVAVHYLGARHAPDKLLNYGWISTSERRQSKTLILSVDKEIARNGVFGCHLSPVRF